MLQTLLLKPREFYRNFPINKKEQHITILLIFAGITRAFDRAMINNKGDEWSLWSVIGFSVVFGILLGWLSFYIYAAMVSWTSGWTGSQITTKSAVHILAYASVPMSTSLLLLAFQIALFGNSVFQSDVYFTEYSIEYFTFNILLLLQFLLSLYSLMIFIIGLAEVQKLSIGKAALQAFSPILFLIAVVAVILGITFLADN